jgi:pseudaminic acid synthase
MSITIGGFAISESSKTFIIAELSANHGHDKQIALDTIRAAKEAGADAIKLQTYTADTLTIDSDLDYFKLKNGSIWDGQTLYQLYKEAYTPWEWQEELKNYAEELGLICFSSPFDKSSVDFLESIHVPAYKIASFEIADIPLIRYVAAKGKPVIISTGMASLADIEEAVQACKAVGNDQIILLKCTSSYPAKIEDANLITIANLRDTFHVIAGLSDHTLGTTVPVLSIAYGAKVIEKHFILNKSIGGPDASFSLDKNEFKQMVDAVRDAEKAIGTVHYELSDMKEKNKILSRSLFAVSDIKAGDVFTDSNVRSIRPGYGLHPRYYDEIIGKNATKDIARGTPMEWKLIQ